MPARRRWAIAAAPVLGLVVFVFRDRRFPAQHRSVGGRCPAGALVVAGWYVSGHLGYGENPETLETVYFATNTRTLESLSFVSLAFSLEMLMLWTDASLRMTFGIASVLGVVTGFGSARPGDAAVPLGRLRVNGGPSQPAAGRDADGLRRRHGAGPPWPGLDGGPRAGIGSFIALAAIVMAR